MLKGVSAGEMSEGEITEADEIVNPLRTVLKTTLAQITQRSRQADPATQGELEALKARLNAVSKTIAEFTDLLVASRSANGMQDALLNGRDLVKKAEELIEACNDAEMPFLKGLEVLPKDESDEALADSDKAAAQAHTGVQAAKKPVENEVRGSEKTPSRAVPVGR